MTDWLEAVEQRAPCSDGRIVYLCHDGCPRPHVQIYADERDRLVRIARGVREMANDLEVKALLKGQIEGAVMVAVAAELRGILEDV